MSLVASFDVDVEKNDVDVEEKKRKNVSGNGRRLRHSIYLGGKTDAKDYDKLVDRWKITHVLNCTPPKQTNIEAGVPNYFERKKSSSSSSNNSPSESESRSPRRKTLVYHRVPIYDSPASLPDLRSKHEPEIVAFIARGLCHGNVLVHCSRGISRSTTSVVLYLMAKRGYRCEDALSLIRRRRPEAQPIPAFAAWLRERESFYRSRDEAEASASSEASAGPLGKKAKRTVSAPIGPAPPSNKPSIGPVLPPTASSGSPIGPALPVTASSGTAIGPEPPPATTETDANTVTAIGPAPPPSASGASLPPKKPVSGIGPRLPP